MNMLSLPQQAAAIIRKRSNNFQPRLAMVLGSGLGDLAAEIENPVVIAYDELPDFPACTVEGHSGDLVLGYLHEVPVACLRWRVHYYEGIPFKAAKTMIRTLKILGCEAMLSTNSSGSLRENVGPGSLVLINDHINFQSGNPMIGPNDDEFGPRFFPMDNAYDVELRDKIKAAAAEINLNLTEGTYIGVLGPNFETPAEIRAFQSWGADAIGMSTVPEVLVANHCGLKVAVIATITNYASGLHNKPLSHAETLSEAQKAVAKLTGLIKQFLKTFETAVA